MITHEVPSTPPADDPGPPMAVAPPEPTPVPAADTIFTPPDPIVPPAPEPAPAPRRWRRRLAWAAAVFLVLLLALAGGVVYVALQGGWYRPLPTVEATPQPDSRKEEAAARRLGTLAPRGVYVVVDTYHNRLRVYRGDELLRDALCSTGSGTILRDPETGREWVFDTPLGEREVQRKQRNPVWIKPDWAFIEEGYKPPENDRQRVDDISLGDYGLYMGDGYIIHGTLFQTLLGRRITHGCIRLGDEDLEYVYHQVPLGARVYLY